MNTQTNDKTLSLISVLLGVKPAMKVDESLTTALQTWVDNNEPASELSETVRADFAKACSAKGLLHDTFKTGLIHVPDSQLQSKTGQHAVLVPAHDVSLDLAITPDTVYRLATQVINLTKRLNPSEGNEILHNPAVGLIALDTILGKMQTTVSSSNSGKTEKNYAAVMFDMGLKPFTPELHPSFISGTNFQHADDNSAITLHVCTLASVLPLLVKTTKKGAFTYQAENHDKYDVLVSSTLDDDFIPVIKLRFTTSKA
jgi:hypothetical protein